MPDSCKQQSSLDLCHRSQRIDNHSDSGRIHKRNLTKIQNTYIRRISFNFCRDGLYVSFGTVVINLSGKSHCVAVETVPSFHDEAQGAKRGSNLIHIFTAEGMRCVHLGDLGCELNEEQVAAIGTPDILFVPVGGFYTIDANQAAVIVSRLAPRIVVPMHYKGEGFGYDVLTPVDDFLALCPGTVKVLSGSSFDVTPDTPAQVIVPAPPNNN